jgi:sodium transport system permease protein
MSAHNAVCIYRKELTEWLRDRRTLISTVVVPLLLFPLLTAGFAGVAGSLLEKAKTGAIRVMVLGGADSPAVLDELRQLKDFEILPAADNWKEQISSKKLRAAVALPEKFQASLDSGESAEVKIYFHQGDLKSSLDANRIEKSLKDYRDRIVRDRLAARHLPDSLLRPFAVKQENVAPAEKVSGAALGGLIGYMVILLCMTGGMYPAIDLTAGEKERGTMETLLTSPVSRLHIVLGKFALVLTASLATAALSVASMGVSFLLVGKNAAALHTAQSADAQALQLHVSLASAAAILLLVLPTAVFFSAAMLAIALFARTTKEAQSYLMPMTFLVIIPAVAALLPGIELTPRLAVIPVLSTSLLIKEIISGTYHWNYIALIFASTCLYASAAMFLAVKMFQRESVLFRS